MGGDDAQTGPRTCGVGVNLYPWDVVGDPECAARVADLGADRVTLAAAYHTVRALTPQHPEHKVVTAAHSAVYYRPDRRRWLKQRLQPVEAHWSPRSFPQAAAELGAAGLESDARHVGRVADLLAEFRNTVVASVGPRLSTHAADLFAELTDREYDELSVDPETYELRISDGGHVFGLDRFSGSEIDLANLALRVAISEHIHFQSGGSVGLLVLDEVFGPLDEDRKARMLVALERLRGRFRQVLVVTHDSEIKEQLPNAIEVVKLPGRRATARPILS